MTTPRILALSLFLMSVTVVLVAGIELHKTPVPPQWKWCAQMGGVLFYPGNHATTEPYCVRLETVP